MAKYIVCVQCMSLYLNMANAPVKIWGKFSQYALQILDFTLNMPHEILGPVAPPTLIYPEYLPRECVTPPTPLPLTTSLTLSLRVSSMVPLSYHCQDKATQSPPPSPLHSPHLC